MAADCEKKRKLIHIKVLDKKGKQFVKKHMGKKFGWDWGARRTKNIWGGKWNLN